MSAGSHETHLDRPEDHRSLERRRWFEQIVMLPVAIGMLSATVGFVARDIVAEVFGAGLLMPNREGELLAGVSAIAAASAFVIAAMRWRRG